MFAWINSANIYQRPAIVFNVTYSEDLEFIKSEITRQADSYVVPQESDYSGGKLPESLPFLHEVDFASNNETGTLLYGEYKDYRSFEFK
jgi:hypothetical protein